jgi:putative ABC transport system permease protein
MKGKMPKEIGEIAIDRMYADNNKLSVGDTLKSGKKTWKITGLVALSDYSALFQNNNDTMFDAIKFGVGIVTKEEFSSFNESQLTYDYAWKYNKKPKNEKEEKKRSEDFMEDIGKDITLESFIPQYVNQAIHFTGDDMGSDEAMIIVLLYIVMVIMAFVFGITTSNTIAKEAGVIGTLRASGYTRGELVRHYMTLPVIVTLIGALVGNILGYTVFKYICADMYYGSYSLPTYKTIWNAEAFVLTTVVPVIIMFVVNYAILHQKLKLSPLKFLRRDLSTRKQKRALYLSPKLKIFHRFRLRVIFQNISNYLVLFVGIVFANLLLMFGLLLPSALDHYQLEIQNNMLAKYQYMLSVPVSVMGGSNKLEGMLDMLLFSLDTETDNEDAEEFSAYSLNTLPGKYKSEEVTLYGIHDDSKYIDADFSDGIYISQAYADKFLLKIGDSITLKEKYEDDEYTFKIGGIYDYDGGLCIFMPQEDLNQMFDLGDDYFSGYFCNSEITDIDSRYIGSVIDLDALTKISRQLNVSMGSMMGLVNGFAIAIYMILIYLLSKIIIEKNAQSISMTKILGYTNGEISRLYIMSTSIVVVLCLLISMPIEAAAMKVLFREVMLQSISGWIALWIDPMIYVKMFGAGFATYAVVALLEYRRIRKVPMGEALKNAE